MVSQNLIFDWATPLNHHPYSQSVSYSHHFANLTLAPNSPSLSPSHFHSTAASYSFQPFVFFFLPSHVTQTMQISPWFFSLLVELCVIYACKCFCVWCNENISSALICSRNVSGDSSWFQVLMIVDSCANLF